MKNRCAVPRGRGPTSLDDGLPGGAGAGAPGLRQPGHAGGRYSGIERAVRARAVGRDVRRDSGGGAQRGAVGGHDLPPEWRRQRCGLVHRRVDRDQPLRCRRKRARRDLLRRRPPRRRPSLGHDPVTDLAVVRADRDGLPAATFQQEPPEVGELAIAIGSPLGFESSITTGITSGLHRVLPVPGSQGQVLVNLIQTDAPISPGNSAFNELT